MKKLLGVFVLTVFIGQAAFAQNPISLPDESPDNWRLAFIDVETTGLQPGYHEMIDIGMIMTDLSGKEISRTFLRIMPEHPERLSPDAAAVNGFSMKRWKSLHTYSKQSAVDSLISFRKHVAGSKQVLLVAYNCSFDAAFLDHLFQSADQTWRDYFYYYILDIPSMAWGLGLRQLYGQRLADYFHIPDEPRTALAHTGITGADLNVRIYQKLVEYQKTLNFKK